MVLPVGSAFFVRARVLQAFRIAAGSRSPTLEPGDRVEVRDAG